MIGIFLSLLLHKNLLATLWQRMLFDTTKINKELKQENYEQNRKTRRLSSHHR